MVVPAMVWGREKRYRTPRLRAISAHGRAGREGAHRVSTAGPPPPEEMGRWLLPASSSSSAATGPATRGTAGSLARGAGRCRCCPPSAGGGRERAVQLSCRRLHLKKGWPAAPRGVRTGVSSEVRGIAPANVPRIRGWAGGRARTAARTGLAAPKQRAQQLLAAPTAPERTLHALAMMKSQSAQHHSAGRAGQGLAAGPAQASSPPMMEASSTLPPPAPPPPLPPADALPAVVAEPVLDDCARDVCAADVGPDGRVYCALEDGSLVVLKPGVDGAPARGSRGGVGGRGRDLHAALATPAPAWRLAAVCTHVSQKRVPQMQAGGVDWWEGDLEVLGAGQPRPRARPWPNAHLTCPRPAPSKPHNSKPLRGVVGGVSEGLAFVPPAWHSRLPGIPACMPLNPQPATPNSPTLSPPSLIHPLFVMGVGD